MSQRLYCGLLLCAAALASVPAPAQDSRLVVANLLLPDSVWPAQRADIIQVLTHTRPDVLAIQQVLGQGQQPPDVCALAQPLAMHCDFVSADPPSKPLRRGMALLSARRILEDGASLLHGEDGSAPVAAGYWRLSLGQTPVNLYSASLSPGPALQQRRLHQARDLRDWMASHAPAGAAIVVARFGARHSELLQLMPGLHTARKGIGSDAAHGLDVLYPPGQARLTATTLLELEPPAASADTAPPAVAPPHPRSKQLLGIVVELELEPGISTAAPLR